MSQSSLSSRVLGILATLLLVLPLAASADEEAHTLPFSDLNIAEPARHFSATQECVEPEEEMKRNHMNYILHQRDETMYGGIRTRQYSLEECINCHASKDENGEYVRVEDSRHFCASCHAYASVKIDCFQCHADVPVRDSRMGNHESRSVPHHTGEQLAGSLSGETLRLPASEDESR
jgi:hypothetical protein